MICDSERILNNAQCDVDRRLVLLFNLHKPQPGIILTSIILNKSSILLCYNSSFKTSEKNLKKYETEMILRSEPDIGGIVSDNLSPNACRAKLL